MASMPQLATAVGRPPMTSGVSAPNPAAAPRLAAPSVNTAPVGRPPMPGAAPGQVTGGPAPAARPAGGVVSGGMARPPARRSFAVKLGGAAPAGPAPGAMATAAQGALGGWNANPGLVTNAVKMLKAGAELGPQHRAPISSLLTNTDRSQPGPFQGGPQAAAPAGYAQKFGLVR